MHWVSWDRTDRNNLKLLAEEGPEVVAEFGDRSALVGGQRWDLAVAVENAAVATVAGAEVVRTGPLKRSKEIPVTIEGRQYLMVNEDSSDWIIDDATGAKVAQFSGRDHGVRNANLEFEGETTLPTTDIVGLAWASRLALESKTMGSSVALIATLLLLTAVGLLVFIF
ncbi:hypothetical protein QP027_08040 [Corynebacterium breve]|uniref:SURF1-like protein n=1 Tax=Corynebacterium breve TaxID=3049799 RepID=A0ABY8VBN1_9CORY|nr:hypothetical protein [Corynebacterium breve]WIM67074.1 hypothetical protein QP027_08040 [Corynebacterium breve]